MAKLAGRLCQNAAARKWDKLSGIVINCEN